jgi:DnaK suppressor protein
MNSVSLVPLTADHSDTADVPAESGARLRGLLRSLREEEAARLAQLATAQDPAFVDEHAEISGSVASETLSEIERALARFDAGEYGSCEDCGVAIPVERLEAIPHTTTCVACAAAR